MLGAAAPGWASPPARRGLQQTQDLFHIHTPSQAARASQTPPQHPNSSENKVSRLETHPKSATLNFLATGSEPLKLHPSPTSLPVQTQRGPLASLSWPPHWDCTWMGAAAPWQTTSTTTGHQHPKKPTSTSADPPTPQQMHQHPNRPQVLGKEPCLKGESCGEGSSWGFCGELMNRKKGWATVVTHEAPGIRP